MSSSGEQTRIGLLQHYDSLMNGYKVSVLTLSIAVFTWIELWFRFLDANPSITTSAIMSLVLGSILSGIFFCFARFFWWGKVVEFCVYYEPPHAGSSVDSSIGEVETSVFDLAKKATQGKGSRRMAPFLGFLARLGSNTEDLSFLCAAIAIIAGLAIFLWLTNILSVRIMVDWWSLGFEFLAVFAGVLAAFCLDNYREGQAENRDTVRILKLLKNEILANAKILNDLAVGFQSEPGYHIPASRPKPVIWSAVANKIDLVEDDEFLTNITQLHLDYDMFDRTLEMYLEFMTAAIVQKDSSLQVQLKNRRDSMLMQIQDDKQGKSLLTLSREIVAKLDAEIRRRDP